MNAFWTEEWARGKAAITQAVPWRRVLLLCAPALLLALGLRVALITAAPSAFINSDVRTIVQSSEKLVKRHRLEVNSKRTFLGSVVYAIPIALKWPLLPAISIGQHALGVVMVLLAGILCALWFRHWEFWIIPLTLILAIDPFFLIYEHVALPDYLYAFFVVLMVLVSTIFWRRANYFSFALLIAALWFLVGARQEGHFYCFMALALVAGAFWRDKRRLAICGAILLAFTAWAFKSTATGQSGQMLMTSTLHLMPDESKLAPGLPQQLAKLRGIVRARWVLYPAQHNETRKKVRSAVLHYLTQTRGLTHSDARRMLDGFCKKIAAENIKAHPLQLPVIGFRKFLATHNELPSAPLGLDESNRRQMELFFPKAGGKAKSSKVMPLFFGHVFKTPDELRPFLDRIYPASAIEPLVRWEAAWFRAVLAPRLPDKAAGGDQHLIGLPLLYLAAVIGIISLAISRRELRWPMLLALATLAMVSFMVFTAANVRARYRISVEAFWWIGLFALLDVIWFKVRAARTTRATTPLPVPSGDAPPQTIPTET